jgi:hypothetical protein
MPNATLLPKAFGGPEARLRPQSPMSERPLWTKLTGHAYRFVREVHAAFPDGSKTDWTGLLQWALGLPEGNSFLWDEKQRIFAALCDLFVSCCRELARLLIDESFLPEAQRTVKPEGGVHRKQFRPHSEGTVIFELAEDFQLSNGHWMYGGHTRNDRLARKRAGHELKSARALAETGPSPLRYPLMAVFTYRGKRVLCTSVLPSEALLVQGKDSASGLFRKPPQRVERVMHSVAGNLLLAKSRKPGEEVYGPSDMEIYEAGGLLYMTQAARLLPPEYRKGGEPAQRYALLRPELMRKAGKPLAPDALCCADDEASRALEEVSKSLDEEISVLARELVEGHHADRISSRHHVKALLHSRGLNMRHLHELLAFDVGCAARTQLQAVLDWRAPLDELHVKTVSCPGRVSEQELRKVFLPILFFLCESIFTDLSAATSAAAVAGRRRKSHASGADASATC